jgi:hypothetical protein
LGNAQAIPFNMFSGPKYHWVKLADDKTTLEAFNTSLGKVIKKYDILSIVENRKMLA